MAFVLDADPQSATMNCYATVAEADDYFSARYGAFGPDAEGATVAWQDLDEAIKTSLLVTASNVIDTFDFDGQRTVRTQPLKWPRKLVYNDEQVQQPSDVVLPKVKQAVFEMAWWKWTEGERPATDAELMQLKNSKVGPLAYEFKEGVGTVPAIVIDTLKSIGPGVLMNAPGTKMGVRSISL